MILEKTWEIQQNRRGFPTIYINGNDCLEDDEFVIEVVTETCIFDMCIIPETVDQLIVQTRETKKIKQLRERKNKKMNRQEIIAELMKAMKEMYEQADKSARYFA